MERPTVQDDDKRGSECDALYYDSHVSNSSCKAYLNGLFLRIRRSIRRFQDLPSWLIAFSFWRNGYSDFIYKHGDDK